MTLHPSPIVYLAIVVAYFYAIHRVLVRAASESDASRVFRRTSLVVLLIAVGSIVIADVWFFTSPLAGWPTPGTWIAPFPFGVQDVTTQILTGE
ncbi:hypothetical protein GCM10027568_32240 [Humibacter soli]